MCVLQNPDTLFCTFITYLTLAMLNKLRYHAHFQFSANQITWSRLSIKIFILNGKQCRSRSVGQLICIYTVCKGRAYPGSAGQGLTEDVFGASVLWEGIGVKYLASITPPTVLGRTIWYFTDVLILIWSIACCFFFFFFFFNRILKLCFFLLFIQFNLEYFSPRILWKCIGSRYLVSATSTVVRRFFWHFTGDLIMVWKYACFFFFCFFFFLFFFSILKLYFYFFSALRTSSFLASIVYIYRVGVLYAQFLNVLTELFETLRTLSTCLKICIRLDIIVRFLLHLHLGTLLIWLLFHIKEVLCCSLFLFVHHKAGHIIILNHIIKTYFVTAIYSRTSTARTSLGPWKCVRDMGSSSHWGLIMVPSQKANGDNLGIFFFNFLQKNCMLSVLIRIASMRRF